MTDAALRAAGPAIPSFLRGAIEARLKARHAQERRFVLYGRMAIIIALAFLAVLLGRIGLQGYTTFIDRPRVLSSSRRFTKMSIPRILFLTNPIAILLFWRARSLWTDWYAHPPR